MTTKYTIYWTSCDGRTALSETIIDDMGEALRRMENMRKVPSQFMNIAWCSVDSNQIGGLGVDTVKDGILPDGQDYVYKTGRDRGREPR